MNHTVHIPENPQIDVTVRHEIVPPYTVEEVKSLMWTTTFCMMAFRVLFKAR